MSIEGKFQINPCKGNAGSMGAVADGVEHQQARTEEQPAGRVGRAQMVRRVRHAAPTLQIHDLSADAHNSFRYL